MILSKSTVNFTTQINDTIKKLVVYNKKKKKIELKILQVLINIICYICNDKNKIEWLYTNIDLQIKQNNCKTPIVMTQSL